MAIYYLLFFSIAILGIVLDKYTISFIIFHRKRIAVFPVLTFLLIFLIEGLRSDVIGPDTWAYKEYFERFFIYGWEYGINYVTDELEIGYKILNLVVAEFTKDPQVLIFVISAIIIGLIVSFLWKTSYDYWTSILLFFGLNHFNTSMISLRQYLAMGIVLWAYPLLKEKKYIRTIICMSLGFMFHQSSLLFCMVLLGSQILKKSRKSVWVILVVEMAMLPFASIIVNKFSNLFDKYFLYYYNKNNIQENIGIIPLILDGLKITLIIYISLAEKYKNDDNITVYGIMISTSVFFSLLQIPYAWRMAYYFDFFLLLIIPDVFIRENNTYDQTQVHIQKVSKNIIIIKSCIFVLCILMFTYYLLTGMDFVPYKFFWQK